MLRKAQYFKQAYNSSAGVKRCITQKHLRSVFARRERRPMFKRGRGIRDD